MKLFRKKSDLYLSDKQPLSPIGVIMLIISYIVLFAWALMIILPLSDMVVSAFNGKQEQYLMINDNFEFSLKHFEYLFNETLFFTWVRNTIFIASTTAILTLLIVSFTGFAYSRYRFKGRKASLMAIMLIQTIPAFAGITAYFTMQSIISSIIPVFSRQMMLILIYSGGGIAGNTFILKGYIDSISI